MATVPSRSQRGYGTLDFIDELYDTAGKCLRCGLRSCEVVEDENFGDYADSALMLHNGQLKVTGSGQRLVLQHDVGMVTFWTPKSEMCPKCVQSPNIFKMCLKVTNVSKIHPNLALCLVTF